MTILVITDKRLGNVAEALSCRGYDIISSATSTEVEVALLEKPALVVLSDGCSICKQLVEDEQIPTILVSAFREQEGVLTELRKGCIDFISESEEVITRKINTYLRLSRIQFITNKLNQIII